MTPIEELFFQIERKKIYISRSVLVNKSMALIFLMITKNEVFIKSRLQIIIIRVYNKKSTLSQ